MKKISALIIFLFSAFLSYGQIPNSATVSNSQTKYQIPNMFATLSAKLPVIDTTDNKATPYAGALTVLPSDTLNKDGIPPIYISNGKWWGKIAGGGGGAGVDSITFPETPTRQICIWSGGFSQCYAIGGYYDSTSYNNDSTYYYHFSNGSFVDSVWIPHTEIFVRYTVGVEDTTHNGFPAVILSAQDHYVTPDSLYYVTLNPDGSIRDSTQWQGLGVSSATANGGVKTTVANMRLLTGISAGVIYETTDYGGGFWSYSAADAATADNTGWILVTADGKRLRRWFTTVLDVSFFGAVGDGIENDLTALNLAILNTPAYATLTFRSGLTYLISDKLIITHPIYIKGNGAILNLAVANKTALSIQSSYVTIDNLDVNGAGYASYNSGGILIITEGSSEGLFYTDITIKDNKLHTNTNGAISLYFVTNVQIDHNEIYNFPYHGIFLLSCRDGKVRDNIITNITGTGVPAVNAYGIAATAQSITDTAYVCKNIEISGNHIKDIPTWEALDTHGGQNITFRNNDIENCHWGILAGRYDGAVLSIPRNIIVDNNTINQEPFVFGHEGYGILFSSTDTSLGVSSGSITNNKMYGAGIKLSNAHGVNIDNNKVFRSANGAGIYVAGTNTGATITNNYFEDIYSSVGGNTGAIIVASTDTLEAYIGANTLARRDFVNPYGLQVNNYGIFMYTAGSDIVFAENDFSGAASQANNYAGQIQQPFRMQGTGSPVSVIQAPIGSQFTRTDGSAVSTLYLKEGALISEWAALSTPLNFLVGSSLSTGFIPYYSTTNTFSNSSVQISTLGNGINVNAAAIGRSGTGYAWIGNNATYTATNNLYNYRFSDLASGWDFTSGNIYANVAASGTQGNPITFTTPFTITNGGRVGIGTIVPAQALHVHGKVQIDSLAAGSGSDSIITVSNGVLGKLLNTYSTFPSQTGNSGKYLTTDGSATSWAAVAGSGVSLTTANTFTTNGAVSAPSQLYTGTWYTGGSATTTKPFFHIETSGATSTGWSTSGTGFGVNAASGFTGNLADLQLNGSSVFKVASNGVATLNGALVINSTFQTSTTNTNANAWFAGASGTGLTGATSTAQYIIGGRNIQFRAAFGGQVSTVATAASDVANVIIGAAPYTEATSGTSALSSNLAVLTPTMTNGSGATTDAQTLYVHDAPTYGTNNYSINAGLSNFRSSVTATQYKLSALNAAPSSASDTGTLGEVRVTATFIYVCTATNTWVRSALATW